MSLHTTTGSKNLTVTLAIFFASGFAALIYQVLWQRLLAIFSGADVYSVTIIVAAFMAGLGAGHFAGGHIADRVSRRTCLALFAAAELAIALFGYSSATLYYDVLYQQLGSFEFGRGVTALVLFGSLLGPTACMGASLPLLARAMSADLDGAARAVGFLYGFNTLGAAFGALVATWGLLPWLGLEGSLRVGAAANIACALVAVPLSRAIGPGETPAADVASVGVQSTMVQGRFWLWALAYGFSGFLALSLEIAWFRLLGVMMKATAFTFGSLLAVYLTGLGLGAIAGTALAARARRPDVRFLALQGAAGIAAGVLLIWVVWLAGEARALRGYFGSYEPLSIRESVYALATLARNLAPGPDTPVDVPANFLRLHIALPIAIVVPPTFLMGCAFAYLQRVVQTDLDRVGRRVGALLLSNITGSLLGTVFTGWLALDWLGTAGTVTVLVALSGVFTVSAALVRHVERGWGGVAAALAMVLVVTLTTPGSADLWARLHGTTAGQMVFVEDRTGLSVVKADADELSGSAAVFANGVGQSAIPYGDIHTALGALPILIHPDPRDVAIIGLGSGDTLHAAAGRPGIRRITGIEIIGSQLPALRAFADRSGYRGLHGLLMDPRVEHAVGDGRAYLMRTRRRFDVIEADALRPTSASSGSLYSDAYFALVKSRLAPGGLAATWVPTQRVFNTFVKTFPYAVGLPGILLGSDTPIAFDPGVVSQRASEPAVSEYFQRAGIDIERLVEPYLEAPAGQLGPDFDRQALTDVNTDLFPRDEFDLAPPVR
jgi:predicted membrane-bound spermidine synthase